MCVKIVENFNTVPPKRNDSPDNIRISENLPASALPSANALHPNRLALAAKLPSDETVSISQRPTTRFTNIDGK